MRSGRIAGMCASLLAAGCSLLLQTAEPTQCSSNRDCEANPALSQRVCQEGFCVVPTAEVTPVTNDAGAGCYSTDICTQANSNEASVCPKAGGPCVPWQTPECPFISGNWKDPNAIVIGSILPLTVRQPDGQLAKSDYSDRLRKAIDLGLEELGAAVPAGISFPGSTRRPLAVLHCDSSFDVTRTRAVFTHLTDVVGSSALLLGGDEELVAIGAEASKRGIAVVCSDCVGPFPPEPLAWRIAPPLTLEAPLTAWRVAMLESEIKARPSPPATMKVAVLQEQPGRGPDAFVSALSAKLRFNGKGVLDNGSNFLVVKTANPLVQAVDHVAHANAIVGFEPDVVVVAMGADFPMRYLALIESKWPTTKARPHYVLTALNHEVTPFLDVLGSSPDDLRKRLSGTRPVFVPELQSNIDSYTIRYKQAYNFHAPDGNHSGYDGFYAMAYAIAAASTQPVFDGPHIAAGFERLRAGTTIDFGPAQIGLALALLGQPGTIDARGLWSQLDWNVTTRDLESDVGMYCFEREPSGGLVVKPDAGPRLTTSTGVVSGTYSCD